MSFYSPNWPYLSAVHEAENAFKAMTFQSSDRCSSARIGYWICKLSPRVGEYNSQNLHNKENLLITCTWHTFKLFNENAHIISSVSVSRQGTILPSDYFSELHGHSTDSNNSV